MQLRLSETQEKDTASEDASTWGGLDSNPVDCEYEAGGQTAEKVLRIATSR